MIKAATDFDSAINYIIDENTDYPSIVTESMDSNSFNNSMKIIESQLNELYEKIRLLEDVRDYCRFYVTDLIRTKEQQFKQNLKIIEDLSDQYRDTDYVVYSVPFEFNTEKITDRDGTEITNIDINNDMLEQAGSIITEAEISNISSTTDNERYNNSYDNLIKGNAGRSYYILNKPEYGGIIEQCTIMFDRSYDCNIININVSNCEISDCKIIKSDKSLLDIEANDTFDKQEVSGVQFTLACNKYQLKNIEEVNKTVDSFCSLNDNIYMRKNSANLRDMENHNEQINRQKDLNKFKADYEQYSIDKTDIDNRNLVAEGV